MPKIITYGVFDFLHLGHIRLFKRIKNLFDGDVFLIVALHGEKYVKTTKPDANILYSESERKEMLESIKYIDKIVVYDFIDYDLPKQDFDILAIGPDQTNEHFKKAIEYCKKQHKQIIVIPRTKGISSSNIRTKI